MSNWTDVAAEADLFEGAGIPVAPGGRDIALFAVEGEVFATDNLCTHGNGSRLRRLCGRPRDRVPDPPRPLRLAHR